MPRKYTRKNANVAHDPLAAGLAASLRPLIQQLVREAIAEILGDWMAKNTPKPAPSEVSAPKKGSEAA